VPVVIQVTDRDEAMLEWRNVVRMADLEAVKLRSTLHTLATPRSSRVSIG
jgi:hypothetical protein